MENLDIWIVFGEIEKDTTSIFEFGCIKTNLVHLKFLLWGELMRRLRCFSPRHIWSSICHLLSLIILLLFCSVSHKATNKKGESQLLLNETNSELIENQYFHCYAWLCCFHPLVDSRCKWKFIWKQLHCFCAYFVVYPIWISFEQFCVLHCSSHLIAAQFIPKLCHFSLKFFLRPASLSSLEDVSLSPV